MQTFKLLLVFVALAAGAAACGNNSTTGPTANERPTPSIKPAPAGTDATADEFATIRADYSQFCISCHKADGTGGPRQLEDGGTLKVPSLREEGLRDSDEELAKQIRDGGDGMPPFKSRLDEKRINDLVRFVRKEFHGRDAGAAPPAR